MPYKKQMVLSVFLMLAVFSFYWYGCSKESEKTYNFLDDLGSSKIATGNEEHVRKAQFAINNDTREVLFEHPNSEVVFKDIPITEKAVLKFGFGINQLAWDKSGDGVLFEIIVIDEKSQKSEIFSQYIDPKNNVQDRKWFDNGLGLKVFAGQKVSFVFKTTVGPKADGSYDWAGWSSPQITTGASKETAQVEKTYNFLDDLGSAENMTVKGGKVAKTEFAINDEKREVLFEHPNSEVVFKDIPITEKAVLKFGFGINQLAWDKSGDGVLFEIIVIDEKSQKSQIFSKYIDPKNKQADRKWFDEWTDLSGFAGQKMSFVFKTTSGPDDNAAYDWAGWSRPQILSYAEISHALKPKNSNIIKSFEWDGGSRTDIDSARKISAVGGIRHPNVILISIDTLRPDHLSAYGYTKPTSPYINSLAKEGVLFKNAVAQSDWTLPSHVSLLTSLYPLVHKVNDAKTKMDSSSITLAEVLKENRYYTAAFVDFYYLSHKYGFDQGFEIYDDQNRTAFVGGGIAKINPKVFEFLDKKYKEKFFLFIHVFDVHAPYDPPSPYNKMFYSGDEGDPDNHSLDFVKKLGYHNALKLAGITDIEYVISAYDGGIAYVDMELGKLLNKLRELKIYDDSLIVITADHGESLFNHQIYMGHGLFLYDDEIKIPLVMKLPNSAFKNSVIEEQVQSIDITPTIIDISGIPINEQFQGRSLFPLINGQKNREQDVYAFGQVSSTGMMFVRTTKWKFISRIERDINTVIRIFLMPLDGVNVVDRIIQGEQLYDLEKDPSEEHNLIDKQIEVANELRGRLMNWIGANVEYAARLEFRSHAKYGVKSASELNKVEITEEEKARLKSLGYVTIDE